MPNKMDEHLFRDMEQAVAFAQVIAKVKQADDTDLSHVVLMRDEIDALIWGLKALRKGSAKPMKGPSIDA